MMQVETDKVEDSNIREQLLPPIIGLLRTVSIICSFHILNVSYVAKILLCGINIQ